MSNIIIFDNDSIGSKLLKHEYKDAEVVKVEGSSLLESFTKFDSKNEDQRIYLPFTVEQLAADNERVRKDVDALKALGFNNQIVLPYQGNEDKYIEYKAKEVGAIGEILKGDVKVDEDKKPYTTVRNANPEEV